MVAIARTSESRASGVFFIAIGALVLAVAIVLAINTSDFIQQATRAEGVVVESKSGGRHIMVEFVDASGKKVSSPQGGWISGNKVGDKVTILYEREAPRATASLDATGTLWFGPSIAGILGLGCLVGGIANVRRPRVA